MPTTYQRADETVERVRDRMLEKYHGELVQLAVNVDLLMAYNPDGDAVSHGGYPAQAKVKIIGLKDRAAGRGDAEIIIDDSNWQSLSPGERDALMDHELEHLSLKRNAKTNAPERDDLNRPKLKMVKHDHQLGWFNTVADRHGESSAEVRQAKALMKQDGQLYFAFSELKSPLRIAL